MARKTKSSYTLYKIGSTYYYNIPSTVTGNRRLRGTCRTDNEQEAHTIALRIVNEFKQRNIYGKKPTMPLGQAINKYWLQHGQFLKSADNSLKYHCKELLTYFGKNTDLHEITTDKLQQFRGWKKSQYVKGIKAKDKKRLVSTTTVNRILEAYRSIYFMARDDWSVDVPEINFKKVFFSKKDRNVHYFTKVQIDQIVEAATEQHTKDMVMFAFFTGLRWSNISSLKWEDIDMNKRIIRSRVKSQKEDGQLLYFEIYDELFDFMKNLSTKSGHVFTYKGGPVKSIRRSFKTACKACGIELPQGQNIHIMRHSTITYLLEKGLPPHIVQNIVGHSDIATTMRYTHVVSNVKRNAMNDAFRSKNCQTINFDSNRKTD